MRIRQTKFQVQKMQLLQILGLPELHMHLQHGLFSAMRQTPFLGIRSGNLPHEIYP